MNQEFMKEKPVMPLVISMALPMTFSMLVNALYNIIDSYFVAQISEDAMTALSLVFPLQNLVNAVVIGGRKNCPGAVSVAGYFFSAGNRTAVCLQRYGIGGEFPFCLEGHSAFDCIRVKVPFCFRTVVIIIPAFNTMPLIGGNGIRCGECRSVLTPIHFLCAGLIPIVWVKSDHEHTVQGGDRKSVV